MDVVAQSAQRIAVDYEIAYTGGTAKTLIVTSNDAGASQGLVAAAQDEYATVCGPGCQVTVVNVPLAQWSTRLQPAVEAALAADRSITIVHPVYDGMTAFAVAGIRAAGAQRRIRIGTVDGSDFVLRMIQQRAVDGLVLFDVGYSLDWQGWADLDVILRVLLGQPVPRTQNLPRRIFDATNVTAAGTPPSPLKGYGDAYRKGYLQLWGVAG
jgi:ribose transport system substrate-binding protein